MAAIDQSNPVANLLSINSPYENSSFVPDSRRSPLPISNNFITITPSLLDLDQQQLQELFDDQDESKVKEEPPNEIEEKKVISSHLQTIAVLQQEMMSLKKKVATLTHQNNRYHLMLSTCEFCTLAGAPFETPQAADPLSEPRGEKKLSIQKPEQQAKSDKFISKMVTCVDNLACKYSPSFAKPKRRNKRPSIVPKVFASIWRFLLAPQKLIDVPEPYPIVDWTQVRPKPGIPDPQLCPVLSVSQDPDYYTSPAYINGSNHRVRGEPPMPISFGTLPGYRTTEGVVAVPSQPQGGYVYCPAQNTWIISASPSRWTARGREPGGCRGGRKKKEERLR